MPIENSPQHAERYIGHARPASVLDAVEQPYDLAALEAINRSPADNRVDQPAQGALTLIDGSQPLALALEEFTANCRDGVCFALGGFLLGGLSRVCLDRCRWRGRAGRRRRPCGRRPASASARAQGSASLAYRRTDTGPPR